MAIRYSPEEEGGREAGEVLSGRLSAGIRGVKDALVVGYVLQFAPQDLYHVGPQKGVGGAVAVPPYLLPLRRVVTQVGQVSRDLARVAGVQHHGVLERDGVVLAGGA